LLQKLRLLRQAGVPREGPSGETPGSAYFPPLAGHAHGSGGPDLRWLPSAYEIRSAAPGSAVSQFEKYYLGVHMPLVHAMKGARRMEAAKCLPQAEWFTARVL
jgi:hypothetical protein